MVVMVVEVVNTANSAVTETTRSVAVVEAVGYNLVQNAYASATPPPEPYEDQIWIDIS